MSAEATEEGVAVGPDGQPRCAWGDSTDDYRAYHDSEWGFPVADDIRLFEKLVLEGFQSGLSWLTILRKRENFRRAFAGFDYVKVARFGERTSSGCSRTPGSCATGARSRRRSTTLAARSSSSPTRARWPPTCGASSRAARARR